MTKEKKKPKQCRNWVFTDFKNDSEFLKNMYSEYQDIIRYIIWGEEVCPTSGKKHKQGWIQFFNKKRLRGVQKLFAHKIHVEQQYGSAYQNDKYCSKDGKVYKFGKFISQGHRTDIENIKKIIDNGANMYEVANTNFNVYLQYGRGLEKYKNMVDKIKRKGFRKLHVEVLYGETDIGKTRLAMESKDAYKIEGAMKWWDGYEGEKCLIIDEYNNDVPITKLLGILDGYELRLPIKGGFTYANWDKVIITMNLTKEQLHPMAKEVHRRALFRRIHKYTDLCAGEGLR